MNLHESEALELSPDQISEYLRNNPTFFRNRDDLLLEMRLPHESGKAISLLERQVNVLRDRNMEMRHRLNKFLDTARDNDKLFEKTKKLILTLLELSTIDDIITAVNDSLQNDFQADVSSLTLLGNPQQFRNCKARVVPASEAHRHIGSIMKNSKAVCGVLRAEELAFLFPDKHKQVGSAAVVPLCHDQPLGVLAIGSFNADYFRSSMGTLFLSHIAEVLNRVLPRHLPKGL